MDNITKENFIELVKDIQDITEVTIEYLPSTNQLKNIGRSVLKRTSPIVNICDSYEEYKKSGEIKNGIAKFIASTASGALTIIIVASAMEAGQIELIPITFVIGDATEKLVEKFALNCLTFLDAHILTPIQEETQKTFDEIFVKPVERAIKQEYFEQCFYEEYNPNNQSDRLEFFMKEYLNFNGHIYEQERYAKNDTLAYNTQGYTQVTLDIPTHNLTHSKSQHIDIVNEYKKALSQIKQDFNNHIPIQVSLTKNEKEEIFYIRKSKTTLANQQSTPSQSNTESTDSTTQSPKDSNNSTTPKNNNPNTKPTNTFPFTLQIKDYNTFTPLSNKQIQLTNIDSKQIYTQTTDSRGYVSFNIKESERGDFFSVKLVNDSTYKPQAFNLAGEMRKIYATNALHISNTNNLSIAFLHHKYKIQNFLAMFYFYCIAIFLCFSTPLLAGSDSLILNPIKVLNQIEANTDHTQIANDINHNIQEIFNTTSQAYIYTRYKAYPQIMQEIQTTLNIKSYEMLNNESYQEPIETQQGLENAYYKGFLAKIKLMQTLLETNLCEAPSEMFRQHYKSNKELANFIIKTSKNNLILHKIKISNNPKLSTAASVLQDYMYRLWAHSKDLNCKE